MKRIGVACARCDAVLVVPGDLSMADCFTGCRLVRLTMLLVCGSCGALLEIDTKESVLT